VLLTVVARAENTGQAFAKNHSTAPEQGRLPVIAEAVDCDVRIKVSAPAALYPLDETGKRRDRMSAELADGVLHMKTSGIRSPWCELVVEQ
jgi:hypothetical protein